MHGVGLSIGGAEPLNREHLDRLKALVKRYQPGIVSEHLAWSTHEGHFLNDLLPLPYNEATLAHVARHVDELQTALGRRVLIENPSTYVTFSTTDMSEVDFLSELVRRTGCGLLLDCNNVYVCAINHHFDPAAYIDAFPVEHAAKSISPATLKLTTTTGRRCSSTHTTAPCATPCGRSMRASSPAPGRFRRSSNGTTTCLAGARSTPRR